MRRLAVRCCCTPGRVLGTIEVPEHAARVGRVVRLSPSVEYTAWRPFDPAVLAVTIELEVLEFADYAAGTRELAVKAEEHKLPLLRRVRGFVENK